MRRKGRGVEYSSIMNVLGRKMRRDRSFHSNKAASDLVVANLVLLYDGVTLSVNGKGVAINSRLAPMGISLYRPPIPLTNIFLPFSSTSSDPSDNYLYRPSFAQFIKCRATKRGMSRDRQRDS